jgi:hypothetical protein
MGSIEAVVEALTMFYKTSTATREDCQEEFFGFCLRVALQESREVKVRALSRG